MIIETATAKDAQLIHELAEKIWWPAYTGIISDDQISFMLEKMYSVESLIHQMEEGITFIIARWKDSPIAFAGFSLSESDQSVMKIHKLYVLPQEQGKGTGKILIRHISETAASIGATTLELNVNRKNPAFGFYQNAGFQIYQTVDIPYYQFELNDYVMRKPL